MKQQFMLIIGVALVAAVSPAQAKVSQQTLDDLNAALQELPELPGIDE